mmetsp:Transcript_27688/g.66698  ORF Transcript_27688/g.66698 Transcript_27688/m.66698 type:complete len:258 (+) Transcript_27688:39-812(+)
MLISSRIPRSNGGWRRVAASTGFANELPPDDDDVLPAPPLFEKRGILLPLPFKKPAFMERRSLGMALFEGISWIIRFVDFSFVLSPWGTFRAVPCSGRWGPSSLCSFLHFNNSEGDSAILPRSNIAMFLGTRLSSNGRGSVPSSPRPPLYRHSMIFQGLICPLPASSTISMECSSFNVVNARATKPDLKDGSLVQVSMHQELTTMSTALAFFLRPTLSIQCRSLETTRGIRRRSKFGCDSSTASPSSSTGLGTALPW